MSTKFITITTASGSKTISLDNIYSIEPFFNGAKIILKEVKNGNNVELLTVATYEDVINTIGKLQK